MEELQLLSQQKPGEVIIDNFQELREALSGVLNRYEHLVYTDDMLADAKADKKELARLRLPSTALIAKDRDERDVILFESEWSIEWALDNNPGLKLTDTASR